MKRTPRISSSCLRAMSVRILGAILLFFSSGSVHSAATEQAGQYLLDVATARSSSEIWSLLSDPDFRQASSSNPLLESLLRERLYLTDRDLSDPTTPVPRIRWTNWVFETELRFGPLAVEGVETALPSYPLRPTEASPTWKSLMVRRQNPGAALDRSPSSQAWTLAMRNNATFEAGSTTALPSNFPLRYLPDPQSRILGILGKGERVRIVEHRNGWYLVITSRRQIGYLPESAFSGSASKSPSDSLGFSPLADTAGSVFVAPEFFGALSRLKAYPQGRWTRWGWVPR
ncbi:MAG: hypothetical protein D6679_14015 [Candidatus Hydrogenedentota bacterium]|nr:MAG: hypothetical protein D6679_14015 [Candidatus Hydrogenedentota bacterium]